jgi:hypothetical protein
VLELLEERSGIGHGREYSQQKRPAIPGRF